MFRILIRGVAAIAVCFTTLAHADGASALQRFVSEV